MQLYVFKCSGHITVLVIYLFPESKSYLVTTDVLFTFPAHMRYFILVNVGMTSKVCCFLIIFHPFEAAIITKLPVEKYCLQIKLEPGVLLY